MLQDHLGIVGDDLEFAREENSESFNLKKIRGYQLFHC